MVKRGFIFYSVALGGPDTCAPSQSPMVRTAFATVGTTQFDELTAALTSAEVLQLLARQGYERLVLQVGRGAEPVMPDSLPLTVDW